MKKSLPYVFLFVISLTLFFKLGASINSPSSFSSNLSSSFQLTNKKQSPINTSVNSFIADLIEDDDNENEKSVKWSNVSEQLVSLINDSRQLTLSNTVFNSNGFVLYSGNSFLKMICVFRI